MEPNRARNWGRAEHSVLVEQKFFISQTEIPRAKVLKRDHFISKKKTRRRREHWAGVNFSCGWPFVIALGQLRDGYDTISRTAIYASSVHRV